MISFSEFEITGLEKEQNTFIGKRNTLSKAIESMTLDNITRLEQAGIIVDPFSPPRTKLPIGIIELDKKMTVSAKDTLQSASPCIRAGIISNYPIETGNNNLEYECLYNTHGYTVDDMIGKTKSRS